MQLPDNSIGITDIIGYRDCPRRMSNGMRRHTEEGDPPEHTNETNYYGSSIHEAISAVEEGMSDEEAVERAFELYGEWLTPEDRDLLLDDLRLYHEREPLGVRTVANEKEIRVPLFKHEGETIYFRGKIDRLYQRLDNPTVFLHRDYKSSKWPKSEKEVHEDLQMWAYNWSIHEVWPECENLRQDYDQLRYGVIPTRKTAEQREQIRLWLIDEVKAILSDKEVEADGLLRPKLNQWCPWCPIMESCPVPRRSADWARTQIEALAGNSGNALPDDLDADGLDSYVADLEELATVRKMIERYEKAVKALILRLPLSERERLGFKTSDGRKSDVWTPEAIEKARELLGDDFGLVATIRKGRLDDLVEDADTRKAVLSLARKDVGAPSLKAV